MEIWIPYGATETLITLGAENLGEIVDSPQDSLAEEEIEKLRGSLAEFRDVVVCDNKPQTLEVVKRLRGTELEGKDFRIISSNPRRVESQVPELKGRVLGGGERVGLLNKKGIEFKVPRQLTEDVGRLVLSTAEPDPLFGLLDSRIALPLSFVTNVGRLAYDSRTSEDPAPFSETPSFRAVREVSEMFKNSTFVTIVPRGGRPHRLLRDASFDAVRSSFVSFSPPRARAAIIGVGGRGYDDSFSKALRLVWGCLECVREGGEILLVCECGEGLGSDALEMLVTGRIGEGGPRKDVYVQGVEEIQYLKRLKETYGVILTSALPETYAGAKLGLATARGPAEAVDKLLRKLGRTTKVNVVTRACECLVGKG